MEADEEKRDNVVLPRESKNKSCVIFKIALCTCFYLKFSVNDWKSSYMDDFRLHTSQSSK